MNKGDFVKSIRKAYDLTFELQVFQTVSSLQPLPVNEEFRDVVLDSERSYPEVYFKGLQISYYNFVLVDFSFFQFSLSSDSECRYAYYPNPHEATEVEKITELYEFVREGLMSEEEYMDTLASARLKFAIPPIRYEYSEAQYNELVHPCSHFHIGFHSENRWAASKRLSPYAFTMLILKHYYPDAWKNGDDLGHEFKNKFNGFTVGERQGCAKLPSAFFSDKEKKLFFLD